MYREIIRMYQQSDYLERNRIWHRALSAMKFSLAETRKSYVRKRRRKPIITGHEAIEDEQLAGDLRAIKRATRLALEGSVTKAAKIMGQSFKRSKLTDKETLEKLLALHPQHPCAFPLPTDAPVIAGINAEELRSAGRRLARGANPGPTGTTDIVVRLLLDDEICCNSLVIMVEDLVNGFLNDGVMNRLNRSRLVAISKSETEVRPVAMGEVITKLAGITLLQRYENTLAPLFEPIQHGVLSRAGCEKIVHTLHNKYEKGQCILSLDLKNAFNTPSRIDIAKAVFAFSAMRPFQRLFHAEYSRESELLYYGTDGQLAGVVPSTAGVRQGSPLATLYFCTLMQPILETMSMEFPEVKIFAYIDDVNLCSSNKAQLESAFFRFKELIEDKKLVLSSSKCVWFGGASGAQIPIKLEQCGVKTEEKAIKILRAYIGNNATIKEKLMQKLEKHNEIFRRLKIMGPNNISLRLLSKSVNVRHSYFMRVHAPDNTQDSALQFDKEVGDVLKHWLGPLDQEQMELARLPVSEGGLGLTACNSIRRAAYAASRQTIFERHNSFSAQIVNRNAVRASEEIRNSTDTNEASERSQKLSHIVRSTTFKGNYDWLQSTAKLVPSHLFRLAVLPRLGMPLQSSMKEIRCPGCQTELNQHSVLTHLPGCTQCKGINASFKHNTLVHYIHKMCLNAGIPCEKEPRRFSSVHCTTCRAPRGVNSYVIILPYVDTF